MDGFAGHKQGDDGKDNGAGKTAEDSNFGGAETVQRIRGMAATKVIGESRDDEGGDVCAHVPAIGQQRHRIGSDANDDLEHHHRRRNADNDAGASLRRRRIECEVVRMAKMGMIGRMHAEVLLTAN